MGAIYLDSFATQKALGFAGRYFGVVDPSVEFGVAGRDGGSAVRVPRPMSGASYLTVDAGGIDECAVGVAAKFSATFPDVEFLRIRLASGAAFYLVAIPNAMNMAESALRVRHCPPPPASCQWLHEEKVDLSDWLYFELALGLDTPSVLYALARVDSETIYRESNFSPGAIDDVSVGFNTSAPLHPATVWLADWYILDNPDVWGDTVVTAYDVDAVYANKGFHATPDLISAVAKDDGNNAVGGFCTHVAYRFDLHEMYGESVLGAQGVALVEDDHDDLRLRIADGKVYYGSPKMYPHDGVRKVAFCAADVGRVDVEHLDFRLDVECI